ncbi:hypothetical protein FA95DRAFT_1598565 [Auriscalpium vulgare]|uniref:Uncharacterized protein n=1 Tax=Auriscalpium vulgare TaxID=40419 RepID=A0ACB8RDU9_9AGAM|nr:hypothetical protein FA95DRAFT_1598565 [Auriscalpium vulgare]
MPDLGVMLMLRTQTARLEVPEDQWPISQVLKGKTITYTNSWQQYREVDVERLAWREHGGPAGWKQFMDEQYKMYKAEYEIWRTNPQVMQRPIFHCPDLYCP